MTVLVVGPQGDVRCVYAEVLDLAAIGCIRVTRASHVEPDGTGHWWADITPARGPVLGPFDRRSDALAAECRWLEENLTAIASARVGKLSESLREGQSMHRRAQAAHAAARAKE